MINYTVMVMSNSGFLPKAVQVTATSEQQARSKARQQHIDARVISVKPNFQIVETA